MFAIIILILIVNHQIVDGRLTGSQTALQTAVAGSNCRTCEWREQTCCVSSCKPGDGDQKCTPCADKVFKFNRPNFGVYEAQILAGCPQAFCTNLDVDDFVNSDLGLITIRGSNYWLSAAAVDNLPLNSTILPVPIPTIEDAKDLKLLQLTPDDSNQLPPNIDACEILPGGRDIMLICTKGEKLYIRYCKTTGGCSQEEFTFVDWLADRAKGADRSAIKQHFSTINAMWYTTDRPQYQPLDVQASNITLYMISRRRYLIFKTESWDLLDRLSYVGNFSNEDFNTMEYTPIGAVASFHNLGVFINSHWFFKISKNDFAATPVKYSAKMAHGSSELDIGFWSFKESCGLNMSQFIPFSSFVTLQLPPVTDQPLPVLPPYTYPPRTTDKREPETPENKPEDRIPGGNPPAPPPKDPAASKQGLKTGQIVAIVIGAIIGVILIGILVAVFVSK